MPDIAFFETQVMHARQRQVDYCFRYQVLSMLMDVDRMEQAASRYWFLSIDRWNLLSLRKNDHVKAGQSMRTWAETVLRDHDIYQPGLRIELLSMPRIAGLGFNPLSLWFCRQSDGSPLAVIAEVRNTFGEKHCYLLATSQTEWPLRAEHDKHFHVSPFIDLDGRYQFEIELSENAFSVQIDLFDEQGRVLRARQVGILVETSSRWVLLSLAKLLAQPLRVWGGIHWQALKIWLNGGKFHSKPAPPRTEVS